MTTISLFVGCDGADKQLSVEEQVSIVTLVIISLLWFEATDPVSSDAECLGLWSASYQDAVLVSYVYRVVSGGDVPDNSGHQEAM